MNLDQIETKCFILALFIRDDDERFLLGSRAYEFKDSQLHFVGNMYQNDVVEVQGNDGIMLAGQVRRSNTQTFDGYIGDSSVDRSTIEQYRRDFMQFFRKNHYYKVVYIFTDGTAIQRRNGFIVEAPEVKELYQLFPEYHIGMNFEDINYYTYEEDSEGQEIYGESATLKIATAATGGLIWEEGTQTTVSGEGSNFTLDDTIAGGEISNLQLKGNTTQQTYSGKNLLNNNAVSTTVNGLTFTINSDKSVTVNGTATANTFFRLNSITLDTTKQYTLSGGYAGGDYYNKYALYVDIGPNLRAIDIGDGDTFTPGDSNCNCYICVRSGITMEDATFYPQIELGTSATSYEPYTGGTPSPNPDYPQEVQVVTGEQTVTITDGQGQSQEYEINLGKNLLDMDATENGGIGTSGNNVAAADNWRTIGYIEAQPNTTYTYSMNGNITGSFYFLRFYQYDKNHNFISPRTESSRQLTVTTNSNTRYIRLSFYSNVGTMTESMARDAKLQIELGSTATSFAPYFTPIELCKIGDYQDYIYKSGDDWYIYKIVEKVTLDGSQGSISKPSTNRFNIDGALNNGYYRKYGAITYVSNCYMPFGQTDNNAAFNAMVANADYGFNLTEASNNNTIRFKDIRYDSTTDFTAWLASNPVTLYYALATPTDTQITNTALITQLNALAAATTYDGQTVFTVTSPNQLGILSLTATATTEGGVVWDSIGATWEEGTGGGPTMINVDSIDNVYPVWTLTGPAVNPQISVLTTNTTLSYSGSITASQELKIDMFNKTATLNGVSVVGNVSGDWVYLKAGVNRITYTTNNADAPDSTIWWQEIVG